MKQPMCKSHDIEEVSIRSPQTSTSCVQESDSEQEVFIKSPQQVPTSMYVPYIEGPKVKCIIDLLNGN